MTLDIIISLLSEIINVSENDLNGNTLLDQEYGIEPIDVARLMIEIEKHFNIIIYDEIVHTFKTLDDVAKYVDTLIS
ncbi:MAG: phosphopantetheine-binding protein [Clostridiales bacterium]|jgi:acyl carrier protein|nr:phosphopantetheine-binding protein [Clostridiales bacterium]